MSKILALSTTRSMYNQGTIIDVRIIDCEFFHAKYSKSDVCLTVIGREFGPHFTRSVATIRAQVGL
jgi:hypothetical protein